VAPDMHIAQLNIARAKAPLDSALLAGFMAQLDPVNALADASPGFVWRLQDEGGDATSIRAFDDDSIVVNMSVWESIEALSDFAYRNRDHLAVMRRRRGWFEHISVYMVLWWVPAGHQPSVAEAEERLEHLRAFGPTPYAFTFKRRYLADEAVAVDSDVGCPA
jgi:hypothetical protein